VTAEVEVEDPPDIRVAEHIELAIRLIDRLHDQIAEAKAGMVAMVQDASLSDAEVAEIYWRFESVPVSALGRVIEVQRIAREHPYWSWRCTRCGDEVFVKSRTEKGERQRGKSGPLYWLCVPCKDAALADREAGWRTAAVEREHRENELRTMPYKRYLQTPEWQERRKAALKRAGQSCQVCNRRRMLHVHHRTYERRGVELARDLIALCDECHALYHGKGLLASHSDGSA
jgi:DNA-directed RNA polymerase subunit RPC12/RpoP